uniref:Basic helix-loop-helix family protein n=2 Tax=Populus alba TaxID=43335 RepID=A0A4U5NAF6_POPAL|nr:transcription factor bHLH52 [Populus alba]TKR79440.1 basic helix-loop-helix family protein [Populus alba]
MALSFCSNLGSSLQHHSLPELTAYPQGSVEIGNHELFGCNDSLMLSDSFINPLYEVDDQLFYSDSYTNLLPFFSSPSDNTSSLSPEISPLEDFESYACPKRQKLYTNHFNTKFATSFFEGYVQNANPGPPEFLPEIPVPDPKFQVPTTFNVGRTESLMDSKKPSTGVSLSSQSIAARERRRKITEKTQQLGKLIPGGNKMNTAEMFQAASKYVKFLQAQIGILELTGTTQENREAMHTQELQTLVTSPTIQEKLYLEQKCLVPRDFVQTIANDCEIQAKPLNIVEEIDQEFLGEQFLE